MVMTNKQADVCLVMPPFSFSSSPSLALGIIKACLLREGVSCIVDYADVHFSAAIGTDMLKVINPGNMNDFYGEYLFAEHAGITPAKSDEDVRRIIERKQSPYEAIETQKLLLQAKEICSVELEKTVDRILASNPKVVGVSSTFQQRNSALAIIKRIKEKRPDILTFMGGANCFGYAGLRLLKTFDFLDYVFFGESDGIIAQVMKDIMKDPYAKLPYGVLKRTDDLPEVPPHRIEHDMNNIPYPDYDDFFNLTSCDEGKCVHVNTVDSYNYHPGLALHLEGSRGCWWGEKCSCTFCGLHGEIRNYRMKDPDRFFEEILYVTGKYGLKRIILTDCVMPREWFDGFLQKLKEHPVKFSIFMETRTTFTEEQIKLLSEAGFAYLQPGVESLSTHELKLMRKGTTALTNIHFIKYAAKYGMHCYWNILYNFPGENISDYEIQIKLAEVLGHLVPPNGCAPIIISRDNEYYNNKEKYNMQLVPAWFYPYSCPDEPGYMEDIAIVFDIANLYTPPEIYDAQQRLGKAVLKWRNNYFAREGQVRLEMADLGDRILIIDTRECRDVRAQLLIGFEREMYLACAHPVTIAELAMKFGDKHSNEEVMQTVMSLANKKLLVKYGNSVLALAIERTMEELKTNDMKDFRTLYRGDREFKEAFNRRSEELYEETNSKTEALRITMTEYAKKCHMCFTGEDYLNRKYNELKVIRLGRKE